MAKKYRGGPHRLLIAQSSQTDMWNELGDVLKFEGYDVDINNSRVVGIHTTPKELRSVLARYDFVVFPLDSKYLAGFSDTDRKRAEDRVLHQAGKIVGIMGGNRVAVLTEQEPMLSTESGIREILFSRQQIGIAADKLIAVIEEELGPRIERRFLQRSLREQFLEREVQIGLSTMIPVWTLVFFCIWILLSGGVGAVAGADEDSSASSTSQTQTTITVPTVNSVPAVTTSEIFTYDTSRGVQFPVTCRLSALKDQNFEDTIRCGNAELELTGLVGPWHNNLRAVQLDAGVSLEVVYERGQSQRFVGQQLNAEPAQINLSEAQFGIRHLDFTFTSANQQAKLFRESDESLEIVFKLDDRR